jgi:hypothetical protein
MRCMGLAKVPESWPELAHSVAATPRAAAASAAAASTAAGPAVVSAPAAPVAALSAALSAAPATERCYAAANLNDEVTEAQASAYEIGSRVLVKFDDGEYAGTVRTNVPRSSRVCHQQPSHCPSCTSLNTRQVRAVHGAIAGVMYAVAFDDGDLLDDVFEEEMRREEEQGPGMVCEEEMRREKSRGLHEGSGMMSEEVLHEEDEDRNRPVR